MKYIEAWIVDFFYTLKVGITMYLYRTPPKKYLDSGKSKISIILIPGISARWGYLKQLGDIISSHGYRVFIVPQLGNNLKDISTSAKIVRNVIEKNNIQHGIFVAHSKGGIIGKYVMVYNNKDQRIRGMVAIATPFSGSLLAYLLPFKPYKELVPASKIIHDLQSNTAVNQHIVSVYPEVDNMVLSKKRSYLTNAKNVVVNEKGHNKVIFSKKVEKIVLASIEKLARND